MGLMQEARQLGRRRALGDSLISLADLHQAIAVRRHGMSMVVMAVMVAGLHLFPTLSGNIARCQPISAICTQPQSFRWIKTYSQNANRL
jgi:hypothetical protein